MSVKDGRLVLPDGMSYRILELPDGERMTPVLLRQDSRLGAGRGHRRGGRGRSVHRAWPIIRNATPKSVGWPTNCGPIATARP